MLALLDWDATAAERPEFAFMPARVLLQDFTGVPCVVDLAALRSAVARSGGDPAVIDPSVPVDLVIDHSVQVDYAGVPDACRLNMEMEMAAQRRALRAAALGPGRVRQPAGHPAGSGHLPSGEPGVSGRGGAAGRGAGRRRQPRPAGAAPPGPQARPRCRRALGLPRHGHRHRLPHHHDQRPGRAGLGGGRHRGRGGHARSALLHAGAAGGGGPPRRQAGARRPPPPTWCSPSPSCCGRSAWSTASWSTSAPAPRACPWPTGRRWPTWPRNTGPPAASSRWTARPWPTCGRPGARTSSARGWKPTAGSKALFREPGSPDPEYSWVVELDLADVRPSLAGPRRPQERVLLEDMPERFHAEPARPGPGAGRRSPRPRSSSTASGSSSTTATWSSPPSPVAPTRPTRRSCWRPGCWPATRSPWV